MCHGVDLGCLSLKLQAELLQQALSSSRFRPAQRLHHKASCMCAEDLFMLAAHGKRVPGHANWCSQACRPAETMLVAIMQVARALHEATRRLGVCSTRSVMITKQLILLTGHMLNNARSVWRTSCCSRLAVAMATCCAVWLCSSTIASSSLHRQQRSEPMANRNRAMRSM